MVLFLGFASLAGGMAGGVTVLVLKYIVPETSWPTLYMGVANLAANGLVMLRYAFSAQVGHSGMVANFLIARWSYGFRRIWRMSIHTTLLYKSNHLT